VSNRRAKSTGTLVGTNSNYKEQSELFGGGDSPAGAVECLNKVFPSEEARRRHFLDELSNKLVDPEFRATPGFPQGSDEDILRLSDPPYYTACPNPFLEDFIACYAKPFDPATPYERGEFAVDVSVGRSDSLYKAHGYHTKVPHLAIVPSILYYTEPGDIVLDGFCGSGMTGVAAQWCGVAPAKFRRALENEWVKEGRHKPKWGLRRVILNDLSPAATFIAAGYNLPFDTKSLAAAGGRLLERLREELGWMYKTLHTDGRTRGDINYTVWSEVFTCPDCSAEIVFLDHALDAETKRTRDSFPCPRCGINLNKDNLQRAFDTLIDTATGEPWRRIRLRPVLINYSVKGVDYEKRLDPADIDNLRQIGDLPSPPSVPSTNFPIAEMYHGSRLEPKGFSRINHMFLPRATHALATLWLWAQEEGDTRLRNSLLFFVEQAIWGMSVLARYAPTHYSQVNQYLNGVYYVGSQIVEVSPWYILEGKLERLVKSFQPMPSSPNGAIINTGDCGHLPIPDNSVDYIFTDPPFGGNIFYADLNFLIEAWHRVLTDTQPEAIIDTPKKKSTRVYQELMRRCFEEYYRVLKPGRWMSVVFSNSSNDTWQAIQEAIGEAGFAIGHVRTLDKQQGSYRQVTSSAVKQDLVISAFKPWDKSSETFQLGESSVEEVWSYVEGCLRNAPVFTDRADVVIERTAQKLLDKMIAHHVTNGLTIPLSGPEFLTGLPRRFQERSGMYFLPDQAAQYDEKRRSVDELRQLELLDAGERNSNE
jgi:hypothetical protein